MDREGITKVFRFVNHAHNSFEEPDLSLTRGYERLAKLRHAIQTLSLRARYRTHRRLNSADWYGVSYWADSAINEMRKWLDPQRLFMAIQPIDFRQSALSVISLVSHGAEIEVMREARKLVIPIENFTLTDTAGEDWLFEDLRIEFISNGTKFRVAVAGPDFEDSGYCHPHVGGDGRICEGDADTIINNGLKNRDVLAVYDVVESLLHNYNADDPYFSLERIHGETCDSCGDHSDDLCACENCEEHICSGCRGNCYCGGLHRAGCYCVACVMRCENCETGLCSNCMCRCKHCNDYYCEDCIGSCDDCGEHICDGCSEYCETCEQHLCKTCIEANHDDRESEENEDTEGTG